MIKILNQLKYRNNKMINYNKKLKILIKVIFIINLISKWINKNRVIIKDRR